VSAAAPQQEQEGNLRLTERPKPKRLSDAARQRTRKAMAQAASKGGPTRAEGSASTLPAGTIPPKRGNDPEDTPEVVKAPSKKRKPDYREAVKKSLQVAIDYQDCHTKKLTEEEGKHIRRELIQLIDMFPSHSESHGPQFNRSRLDQGVFK